MSAERLLAALAARAPDAVVLRGETDIWRAADVLDTVAALAMRLSGHRVLAVLADNSPAWVMADLAALRTGTVHLPLPTFFSPTQMAHVLAIRSETQSLFRIGLASNRPLLGAVLLTLALQLATIYVPLLNPIFKTHSLPSRRFLPTG